MKIYGTGTFDNQKADTATFPYIELALNNIHISLSDMDSSNCVSQSLLADIQILIRIIEIYPHNISGRLKKSEIDEWKKIFNQWFERVKNKIKKEYADSIIRDSERLFLELNKYAHDISWL